MHVAGIDVCHHKRRHPHVEVLVEQRLVARRLLRSLEAWRQHEGIAQHRYQARIVGRGGEDRLHARSGPARKRALHLAHATLDARNCRTELLFRGFLKEPDAELERQGIVTAGEHDTRAALACCGFVRVDHLTHPYRLAAQIEIVGAARRAGRDQIGAVELIGSDCGEYRRGAIYHGFQRRRIAGVGRNQRQVARRADRIPHRSQLVETASGHRPFDVAAAIFGGEIFGDKLPRKSTRPVDNDIEFRRWLHVRLLESACLACRRKSAYPSNYFFAYDTPMPARTSLWIPYGAIG